MATDSTNEFDLGPLSWVQGEIDQALTRGLESLAAFRAAPADPAPLKHARTHVHQAAGAIQMVGLDAVVAFCDEIERQLSLLAEMDPREIPAVCDLVDKSCRKLRIFLDELVKGAPPVPLKLFPEYELMQRSRGVRASAPTDLFYPDLGPRAPRLGTPQVIPPNKLPSYMVKQRRLYQRGLLGWLRGDDEGAVTMRDAVAAIESATTQQNLRAFWWTVGALLDALVERGLESGFGVKQLAARVDLQIRRVVEGSGKVADRLRREVLYYVAISAPVAPSVQAVQRGFRLGGLIPSAEVLNADLVRIEPHLRDARELLNAAKDAWLKFTSGRPENLPKLKQTLASVHKHAAEVGNGALMKLTAALVERLNKLPQSISEPFAMEYATGILLAESAFENYASLSQDFPKQVEAMVARLGNAQLARPAAGGAAPLLDEMSKRAQERVLLAQVGREIQTNLRHMEQVLDAFFRDPSKRGELATLTKDSQQIRARSASWASTTPSACSAFAKRRSTRMPIRRPRFRTRTSSSSPRRCRGSASTSRRSSSSVRTASGSSRRSSRSASARRRKRLRPTMVIQSRRRSGSCAMRCRSSSTRSATRPPTLRSASRFARSSRASATTPS